MDEKKIQYLKKYWSEIEAQAKELCTKNFPLLSQEDFNLFHTTGNRLIYEKAYFGRRKFLTVLGIYAEFSNENSKKEFDRLETVIREICKERFWALPAHVNFDALDENTIDLFAAETAGTLSEMTYLFWNRLQQETKEIILSQVIKRVIRPFLFSTFPYSFWENDSCNWAAVCAGNIGMTVIYLDKIEQELGSDILKKELCNDFPKDWKRSVLDRVMETLHCYLDGMEEDGTCTEGLGYFSYGMSYFTAFTELLQESRFCETFPDLLTIPKCKKIALFQQKCFFKGGISLSFSDCSQNENYLPGLTAYLKWIYPEVKEPDETRAAFLEQDACYRWITNERNIRWLLKYDKEKKPMTSELRQDGENEYYLPDAQWMICQDEEKNGYAIKGGHNDENHNHNDIGSFLCAFEGDMLLADLGAGEYTKDYFSDGRYEILCNRSLGHNVPLINGTEQVAGKEYKAASFIWNEIEKKTVVSFAGAYTTGIIDKIERTITMNKKNELELEDTFLPSKNTKEITENFITYYKPEIKNDGIEIKGKQASCLLTVKQEELSKVKVIEKEHFLHDGEKIFVYLLQWRIPCKTIEEIAWKMKLSFRLLDTHEKKESGIA